MQELPFAPFPFLQNPHRQTAIGFVLGHFASELPSVQKLVPLPDGDCLSLEITTPKNWKSGDLTVLLIHGLCGSHRSPYVVRMAKRLQPLGIRTVRLNLRGCGSGRGLAKGIYHSGRSEDLIEVLTVLKKEGPIILIGYSLGGNIALKSAGELQGDTKADIKKVIAVNAPVELYKSVQLFDDPANVFYERWFSRELRAHVLDLHNLFKNDLPPITIKQHLKMSEFDDLYTAPRAGFSSGQDYYSKCSAISFIDRISLPTQILFAEDDPFICPTSLDKVKLPPNIQLFKTKQGGHLGYLGNPLHKRGFRWLDSLLVDWILNDT